jgi:hypothetical protein
MDTVRRYSMLFDRDWVDTDDRFEINAAYPFGGYKQSRLDRRAFPLLLSTPGS